MKTVKLHTILSYDTMRWLQKYRTFNRIYYNSFKYRKIIFNIVKTTGSLCVLVSLFSRICVIVKLKHKRSVTISLVGRAYSSHFSQLRVNAYLAYQIDSCSPIGTVLWFLRFVNTSTHFPKNFMINYVGKILLCEED